MQITGKVVARPEKMRNSKLVTGDIEIHATLVKVLAKAEPLPFEIDSDSPNANEETRLKFRYLDLRRAPLQKNLLIRHKLYQSTRRFLDEQGFLEIETPILYKSTPEGARDYLVPSRVHKGSFYALPQSPQTLKQLLMISGFEKYFQIARCFRDEDLRADRQPEFTQIDIEASFFTQNEFLSLMEQLTARIWKDCIGVDIQIPFPRLLYQDAIEKYGSDKPDLRFGLELKNISPMVESSSFQVFSSTVKAGGAVVALAVTQKELKEAGLNIPDWSRKFFDQLNLIVQAFGLKGVAWVRVQDTGTWNSSIAKFFTPEEQKKINLELGTENGDYILFGAEKMPRVFEAMGSLRRHLARELGLITEGLSNKWAFTWITEFPLFEFDEKQNRLAAAHHPFTRPIESDVEILKSNDLQAKRQVRAHAYDLALNGFEVAGGSLRIFDPEVQSAMFRSLGLNDQQAKEKFGFFIDALKFGTPPHGGIAFGVDRLAMLLCGTEAIRDVIAFPKTTSALCQMSESPSEVDPEQLAELRIQVAHKTT